jgi:GTPase SAR1 family protein
MPFINPLAKISCPYCLQEFHPGDCAIVSTINPGKVLRPAPTPRTFEYTRSRTWIEELKGPEFTTEMAVRECPHCKKPLFEHIEECDNINIAIVGDASSGKTHYIAVLIDMLKRGVLMQGGNGHIRLIHLNEYTNKTYQSVYQKPILLDRNAVAATPRGSFDAAGNPVRTEPLIYQLSIHDNATDTNNTLNLLLYDISGEDLADTRSLMRFGEHILRAHGIIYFADPLAMMNIYQYLPSHIQAAMSTGRRADEVLSTVLYRMEQYKRVQPGAPIDIPTAITISKSDLFQYVIPRQEWPGYGLLYKPTYDGRAHLEDIQRVDQEVRYLLQKHGEFSLLQISRRFEQVSFFAIAATGQSPDGNSKYTRIDPHRGLDPFIWLLWKLHFLPEAR